MDELRSDDQTEATDFRESMRRAHRARIVRPVRIGAALGGGFGALVTILLTVFTPWMDVGGHSIPQAVARILIPYFFAVIGAVVGRRIGTAAFRREWTNTTEDDPESHSDHSGQVSRYTEEG